MNKPLYTFKETCEILHIGRDRLYKFMEQKLIKGFRIGSTWRFPAYEIDRFIRAQMDAQENL